jgi:hypothetical protein
MAIVTSKDTTSFEVDFLSMYNDLIKSFLIDKILEFPNSGYNEEKEN